jgi:prepilin-type N-terminal cleavage/methylation domain-containing protein
MNAGRNHGGKPLKDGFTLVELLVVIAVIAILAALLLPSLIRAKQKAQAVYCMNNGHQLMFATHLYASDNHDWLPPNEVWLTNGPSLGGGLNSTSSDNLMWLSCNMSEANGATNVVEMLYAEGSKLVPYSSTQYKLYKCPADKSTWTDPAGAQFPTARTYSMNGAVGTEPYVLQAVSGAWLDGAGKATTKPWQTYGKLSDIADPSPSSLWVFIDEARYSMEEACFGICMLTPTRMVNWPGTYHNFGAMLTYADCHSEVHKWSDPRTKSPPGVVETYTLTTKVVANPDNADIVWLQQRTSALKP